MRRGDFGGTASASSPECIRDKVARATEGGADGKSKGIPLWTVDATWAAEYAAWGHAAYKPRERVRRRERRTTEILRCAQDDSRGVESCFFGVDLFIELRYFLG
jgi:hypothetical protein